MSIITFIKLIFNLKIWLNEKWDTLFPIKNYWCFNNNIFQKIYFYNNAKSYEKICVEYEIDSKIYKKIYYNICYNDIKKIPIKEIPFINGVHKPILSMRIKLKKYDKYINISTVIPHIKEFNQSTIFNDFILFNIKNIIIDNINELYYKIYIKTLTKKFHIRYSELKDKTIQNFYQIIK